MEITRELIEEAARRIEGWVRRTPVLDVGSGLVLKLDHLQPTGSFKVRGAFSFLTARPGAGPVVAASGGNFGLAIAHAAAALDRQAVIFVPASSPQTKVDRIIEEGADVHVVDGYYADSLAAARGYLDDHEAIEAHAYDDIDVVAGQGTCGREILDQVPDVDTVVVATGGGGLIGGIASWIREDARVVCAETHGTPAMSMALAEGGPTLVEVGGIAADSLGAARVGEIGYHAASRWVDRAVLVTDDDVRDAQRWLWHKARILAEPGAATAVAAVLSGAYRADEGERVCVVVCGANLDPSAVAGIVGRDSENVAQPSS